MEFWGGTFVDWINVAPALSGRAGLSDGSRSRVNALEDVDALFEPVMFSACIHEGVFFLFCSNSSLDTRDFPIGSWATIFRLANPGLVDNVMGHKLFSYVDGSSKRPTGLTGCKEIFSALSRRSDGSIINKTSPSDSDIST